MEKLETLETLELIVEKKERPLVLSSLILNFINVCLVMYCLFVIFFSNTTEELKGTEAFMYFTADSAIFSAIASIFCVIFDYRYLTKRKNLPNWLTKFKFMAVGCTTLTFMVVLVTLFVLYVFKIGFTDTELGYNRIVSGTNLLMHLVCPILSIVTFFIEPSNSLKFRNTFMLYIPVGVYILIYLIMAILLPVEAGGWGDLYSVLSLGIPLCLGAVVSITTIVAFGLRGLQSFIMRKMHNRTATYFKKVRN